MKSLCFNHINNFYKRKKLNKRNFPSNLLKLYQNVQFSAKMDTNSIRNVYVTRSNLGAFLFKKKSAKIKTRIKGKAEQGGKGKPAKMSSRISFPPL